eukprot:scaffold570_cov401-Pavlova_lutheri.AAC.8
MASQFCLKWSDPSSGADGIIGCKFCNVQVAIPICICTECIDNCYAQIISERCDLPLCLSVGLLMVGSSKPSSDAQCFHEVAPVCAGKFCVAVHYQIGRTTTFRDPMLLKLEGQFCCTDSGSDGYIDCIFGKSINDNQDCIVLVGGRQPHCYVQRYPSVWVRTVVCKMVLRLVTLSTNLAQLTGIALFAICLNVCMHARPVILASHELGCLKDSWVSCIRQIVHSHKKQVLDCSIVSHRPSANYLSPVVAGIFDRSMLPSQLVHPIG